MTKRNYTFSEDIIEMLDTNMITFATARVLHVLYGYHLSSRKRKNPTKEFKCSDKKLDDALNNKYSRITISNSIKLLEALGIINREKRLENIRQVSFTDYGIALCSGSLNSDEQEKIISKDIKNDKETKKKKKEESKIPDDVAFETELSFMAQCSISNYIGPRRFTKAQIAKKLVELKEENYDVDSPYHLNNIRMCMYGLIIGDKKKIFDIDNQHFFKHIDYVFKNPQQVLSKLSQEGIIIKDTKKNKYVFTKDTFEKGVEIKKSLEEKGFCLYNNESQ